MDKNTKNIVIALAILAVFLFVLILIFSILRSSGGTLKKVSDEFKNISIKNILAKEEDFSQGKSKEDMIKDIEKSISLIKESLVKKSVIIDYDKNTLNDAFDEISKMISDKKYEESLKKTKEAIDKINAAVTAYNEKQKEDIEKINKLIEKKYSYLGAVSVNQKIEGDYAVAITKPKEETENNTLTAKTFLKKEGSEWKEVSSGTMFDKKSLNILASQEFPESILKSSTEISPVNQLTPLIY